MAEEGNTPTAPTTDPPPADPKPEPKFVGKYETQDAFETGLRELGKTVDIHFAEDAPLIGEGRPFSSVSMATEAYKSMARIQSRKADQPPADPKPEPKDDPKPEGGDKGELSIKPPEITPDADEAAVLAAVGVDAEEITQQWATDGKLDDDAYAKFAAKGYPRQLVDGYMRGKAAEAQATQAQVQQMRDSVTQQVGGEKQLNTLAAWAATNLVGKDPTFDALNSQVDGNPSLYPAMMQYVASKHTEAVGAGNSRPLVTNGTASAASGAFPARGSKEYRELRARAMAGDAQAKATMIAMGKQMQS